MRAPALLLAVPLLLSHAAGAQVTLDLKALDQRQPPQSSAPTAAPTDTEPKPRPAPRQPVSRKAATRPAATGKPENAAEKPAAPDKAATATKAPKQAALPHPPTPSLPSAPPAELSLPTIVVPAPTKQAPPPVPPVSASANTTVAPLTGGVRVVFTPDRIDLSQDTVDKVKSFVDSVPRTDTTSFNIAAFAAGPPEDPSTPRRLSLSRALAVRSVLMAEGVPSERIYVRALGTGQGGGPRDRVDLTALGTNGPPASQP